MATNYSKYINSTGTHYISNSGSDENGALHSGKAGDQNGKEWRLRSWYSRPWTHVLRHSDPKVRQMIAEFGIDAALNDKIGYDQWQRYTYWDALCKSGYRPANVQTACEADCTAGVTANVRAIGHILGIPKLMNIPKDTRSGNMRARFKAADFQVLMDKKYLTSGNYLLPGDILLYENHHAATNITKGKSAVAPIVDIGLRRGDKGADVREMQRLLMVWNVNCLPKYGADGDYGMETEKAVFDFQKAAGLPQTGVYDSATEKALKGWGKARSVQITGATVNVRSAPGITGRVIGIANMGESFLHQGETKSVLGRDWYLIEYAKANAWVSSKYAKIVE